MFSSFLWIHCLILYGVVCAIDRRSQVVHFFALLSPTSDIREGHFKRDRLKRNDLAKEKESEADKASVMESSDGEEVLLMVIKGLDHTIDS